MTGTLTQLIAMVAYGNRYIAHSGVEAQFPSNHIALMYCNQVLFSTGKGAAVIAENPDGWFSYLLKSGCKVLKLYYESADGQQGMPDHKLAGMIGGGGTWLIEAIYPQSSDFWYGAWEVSNQQASDNRIWTVDYKRIQQHIASRNQQPDIGTQRVELSEILTKIAAFAREADLDNFAGIFERASASLTGTDPGKGYYHSDLLPKNTYSLAAQQLLFAAAGAWVFGGMGSWNDMGFGQGRQQEYESLSSALYQAINSAVIAAVNS